MSDLGPQIPKPDTYLFGFRVIRIGHAYLQYVDWTNTAEEASFETASMHSRFNTWTKARVPIQMCELRCDVRC